MNSYRIRVQPASTIFRLQWQAMPDEEFLISHLPGLSMNEIVDEGFGTCVLDFLLQRPDHVQVINEVLGVLQTIGYTVLDGEVSELAGAVVEGALLGALGGGALGSTAKSGHVAAIVALIGAVAGGLVGSTMKRVEKVYQIEPAYPEGWALTLVPLLPVRRPGPGLAAA